MSQPPSSFQNILQSLQELALGPLLIEQPTTPLVVSGLPLSSQAYLFFQARKALTASVPWVLFCPDSEAALRLTSDLECFASLISPSSPQKIAFYPGWEHSPYSSIEPSLRIRLKRISVLQQLQEGGLDFLVTTLSAFSQATLPVSVFQGHSLLLKKDSSTGPRETFIRSLLRSGYLQVDTVEDPGTFAVRGEICDLYPVSSRLPIRLEWFDTLIERLRFFHPQSQKTVHEEELLAGLGTSKKLSEGLHSFFVPPATEALLNDENLPLLKSQIKLFCDEQGILKSIRDHSRAPSDYLIPWLYEKQATLMDYLPPKTPFVWSEELECQQQWDTLQQKEKQAFHQRSEDKKVIPPPPLLFGWHEALKNQIQQQTCFFLSRLQWTTDLNFKPNEESLPPSEELLVNSFQTQHSVLIKTHEDLRTDSSSSSPSFSHLQASFENWIQQQWTLFLLCPTETQLERVRFLLQGQTHEGKAWSDFVSFQRGDLSEGFRWPQERLAFLTEADLLGTRPTRKSRKRVSDQKSESSFFEFQALSDLEKGDLVVHVDHGIGKYQGLMRLDLTGAPTDFLVLEYANQDKLYLPVYRLNVIQKYQGGDLSTPLDRLGSQQFIKTKEKVRDSLKRIAIDLVQLYAERQLRAGVSFPLHAPELEEFEAQFPFEETPDQQRAIEAVSSDLASGKVMDRVVCGDVGYGKTEVAIRAAFQVALQGKQVAVLVPTTLLAQQHEASFQNRMKDAPFLIRSLSRFKTAKEQSSLLKQLAEGKIDIVIGTHRLLSQDVHFRDLGLVIIDEEHRFGVEHKEKLKTFRIHTHVLTLTATPIPRTLHMALAGLRDLSLMHTPPVDRLPIRTYVAKYDEAVIQKAIQFELSRGGQVFYLYPQIESMKEMAEKLQSLVPEAKIVIGHGQMPEKELEQAMIQFYEKQANVLLCTTIIESGLDIPSANTLLVHRADRLGLAQLYQIRGRVGRGQQRGYAYLLIPAEKILTEEAKKRLEVIQKFVDLGSGFQIASHDLEIRGGGDLLGAQQSGNIAAVGFELYTQLLEEAIQDIQQKEASGRSGSQKPTATLREPEMRLSFPAFLSEVYIPDVHQRLSFYRRLSSLTDPKDIPALEEELLDRFGKLPAEAENLLWLVQIKMLLKKAGITGLTLGPEKMALSFSPESRIAPEKIISLITAQPKVYQLLPDSKLMVQNLFQGKKISHPKELFFLLNSLLTEL